ncbi:MAG: glycosyltransferase family 4 protein [Bacteroidia bacterium]
MPRILFVAPHRMNRAPSQRFRFEQYFYFLQANGFECNMAPLISKRTDRIFYHPKSIFRKILIFWGYIMMRLQHVIRSSTYDIIFIQREAFMTGTTFFEKQFKRSGARVVYDFDDAIWHHDVSDANKKFARFKRPEKTEDIIAMSDLVIAGNQYLFDYAQQFNKNVKVIPTTIDTDEYVRKKTATEKSKICIGWSGSVTTIKHFNLALNALEKLKEKYGDKIYFKVIGDSSFVNEKLGIKGITWNRESELEELSEINIGIMPLPDDEWSKGKCGLKGLQYMALEIAAVMSPIGVNTEIIEDGINGFLAKTDEEWIEKISMLIEDEELRKKIGKAARQTVVEKYSIHSQQSKYLQHFSELIQ